MNLHCWLLRTESVPDEQIRVGRTRNLERRSRTLTEPDRCCSGHEKLRIGPVARTGNSCGYGATHSSAYRYNQRAQQCSSDWTAAERDAGAGTTAETARRKTGDRHQERDQPRK